MTTKELAEAGVTSIRMPSKYDEAMHALKLLYESTAMLRLRVSIVAEPVKQFSEWSQSTAAMTLAEQTLGNRKSSHDHST